jgi:hypothetical protein
MDRRWLVDVDLLRLGVWNATRAKIMTIFQGKIGPTVVEERHQADLSGLSVLYRMKSEVEKWCEENLQYIPEMIVKAVNFHGSVDTTKHDYLVAIYFKNDRDGLLFELFWL